MKRECSQCRKPLTPQELSRDESRGMEAERRAAGLHGVHFSFFVCSGCQAANIFVDVHPVEGETDEVFRRRRDELRGTVRQLDGDSGGVVFVERAGHHLRGRG